MIKVKAFYIYNDSLKNFSEKVEKELQEESITEKNIISVIPVTAQNFLGTTYTSGILFIYSK